MKRLGFVAAAIAVAALVGGPFVFAGSSAVNTALGAASAVFGPQPRGEREREGRGDRDRRRRDVEGARDLVRGIGRLYGLALIASKVTDDADLQRLVNKSITDRRAMIQSELAALDVFEDLVHAVRSGDREKIQAARARHKEAREKVRADAKKVGEDVAAVAKRLKELRPDFEERVRERRGGERRGGRDDRQNPGRRNAPPELD